MLNNWMRRRDQDTGDSSISVISDCGVARKSSEKLETHHMPILKTVRCDEDCHGNYTQIV